MKTQTPGILSPATHLEGIVDFPSFAHEHTTVELAKDRGH